MEVRGLMSPFSVFGLLLCFVDFVYKSKAKENQQLLSDTLHGKYTSFNTIVMCFFTPLVSKLRNIFQQHRGQSCTFTPMCEEDIVHHIHYFYV